MHHAHSTRRLVLFAVLLSCLGVAHSASAYSLKHTEGGHPVRWDRKRVELRVGAELRDAFPRGQAYAAATMAAEAWRGFQGVPDIVVAEGTAPPYHPFRRGNGIHLLEDWPLEPDQIAVTVTTYDASGSIRGVDVLINGERPFTLLEDAQRPAPERGHDLAAVLTHELGHVLGLDETLDDEHATMWPEIPPGDTAARTLTEDDIEGVLAVYRQQVPPSGMHCKVTLREGNATTPATWTLLSLVAVLARRRRRHPSPARGR